jgi:hypothetical protein
MQRSIDCKQALVISSKHMNFLDSCNLFDVFFQLSFAFFGFIALLPVQLERDELPRELAQIIASEEGNQQMHHMNYFHQLLLLV